MSDEVASHLTGIIESMSGFLAAMLDPEMGRHAADPAASNFIAGNPQELASPRYVQALQRWAEPKDKDWFGYKMPHRPALVAAAEGLSKELGLSFNADDIVLARGAHGRILFDGNRMITPGAFYPRSLLIHTYSKSALAPGQRLGYVALPPGIPGRDQLRQAFMVEGFSTGNMLPDAIMQYALPEIDAMSIDLDHLQRKRDRMVNALREMGYEVHPPQATFYLLPKAPIEDELLIARALEAQKVLVLPGAAVDMPGYFRISLTATDAMIDRALPVFAEVRSGLAAGVPR